jgi:hypothetical protein
MNGDVFIRPLLDFLMDCSDERVRDKWVGILSKSTRSWGRLDIFDLWINNVRGEMISRDYDGASLDLIMNSNRWAGDEDVYLYLVGRNKNNGYIKTKLHKAIAWPMVEGIFILEKNHKNAICLSHHGDIRVFD